MQAFRRLGKLSSLGFGCLGSPVGLCRVRSIVESIVVWPTGGGFEFLL